MNDYGVLYGTNNYENTMNSVSIYSALNGLNAKYSRVLLVNNLKTYNNDAEGISLRGDSQFNIFNNIQAYDNGLGIKVESAYQNTFNNTQVYNNSGYGISAPS